MAAWFLHGRPYPYAYMGIGLSELMVFVFFGLLACVGTAWTRENAVGPVVAVDG